MNTETLIQRFHDRSSSTPERAADPDSLIGFFQNFRPDGKAIIDLFDDLELGDRDIRGQLNGRLEALYRVAGDDRRPQGGRDAYFVVRDADPLDPEMARKWAGDWLTGLRDFAMSVGEPELVQLLDPFPAIRVLEGIAPKHPKADDEKSDLLKAMQQTVPAMVEQLDVGPFPAVLRPAYYFIACDAFLRDYLMWPLYAGACGLADPLEPYFKLWSHGVKYRIFNDSQIDLYLPRRND